MFQQPQTEAKVVGSEHMNCGHGVIPCVCYHLSFLQRLLDHRYRAGEAG